MQSKKSTEASTSGSIFEPMIGSASNAPPRGSRPAEGANQYPDRELRRREP
jgi:hypothetical protein